jgi:hypothetical protein
VPAATVDQQRFPKWTKDPAGYLCGISSHVQIQMTDCSVTFQKKYQDFTSCLRNSTEIRDFWIGIVVKMKCTAFADLGTSVWELEQNGCSSIFPLHHRIRGHIFGQNIGGP